jgi:hypothetical protein
MMEMMIQAMQGQDCGQTQEQKGTANTIAP